MPVNINGNIMYKSKSTNIQRLTPSNRLAEFLKIFSFYKPLKNTKNKPRCNK